MLVSAKSIPYINQPLQHLQVSSQCKKWNSWLIPAKIQAYILKTSVTSLKLPNPTPDPKPPLLNCSSTPGRSLSQPAAQDSAGAVHGRFPSSPPGVSLYGPTVHSWHRRQAH